MNARGSIRFRIFATIARAPRWGLYSLALALLLAGLPATLVCAAELTAASASPQPVATLKPLKTLGKWMETQPFLAGGRIEYLRILNVNPNSPAALAGVQDGMRIIQLQGVDVRGLTEAEFDRTLESMPAAVTLTLVVDGGLASRTIIIPVTRTATLPPAPPSLPPAIDGNHPMSDADIKSRLDELREAIDREMVIVGRASRAESEQAVARGGGPPLRSHVNPELLTQAGRLAAELARQNVTLLCATAARERDKSPLFARTLIDGLDRSAAYSPAHKAAVLDFLPQFPQLIATVERLQWTEEAKPRIRVAWKRVSRDQHNDLLALDASRLARAAAKIGIADALIAAARSARALAASKRRYDPAYLQNELEALRALVPAAPPGDVANYIVNHRRKLVFDPATTTYSISSPDTR